MVVAKHFQIRGRVQGVFYRGSARNEARRLGLVGWVKNLAGGSVEAYACGEETSLNQFEGWLRTGPPHARVNDVVVSGAVVEELADFIVR